MMEHGLHQVRKKTAMICAVLIGCFLVGCATPPNFSMYPQKLQAGQNLAPDMAVVLVGITGPAAVNYLQFTNSSTPAINARFDGAPEANGIVAIPIPVGLKKLSLGVYTRAGSGGGYLPSGASFGYIDARTPPLDITEPAIYYLATIDTSRPGQYSLHPLESQLTEAKAKFTDQLAGKNSKLCVVT
jgi:hypothetical protein